MNIIMNILRGIITVVLLSSAAAADGFASSQVGVRELSTKSEKSPSHSSDTTCPYGENTLNFLKLNLFDTATKETFEKHDLNNDGIWDSEEQNFIIDFVDEEAASDLFGIPKDDYTASTLGTHLKSAFMALTCDEVEVLALAVVDESGSGKSGKGGFGPASDDDCFVDCFLAFFSLSWWVHGAAAFCAAYCYL